MRTSAPGAAFGSSKLLLAGASNGQLEVGAAADGGGFLVANNTGSITSPGKIVAAAFGKRSPTDQLGIRGVQGGGDPSITETCQQTISAQSRWRAARAASYAAAARSRRSA